MVFIPKPDEIAAMMAQGGGQQGPTLAVAQPLNVDAIVAFLAAQLLRDRVESTPQDAVVSAMELLAESIAQVQAGHLRDALVRAQQRLAVGQPGNGLARV